MSNKARRGLIGWTYATGPLDMAEEGANVEINVHLGAKPEGGNPVPVILLSPSRFDRDPERLLRDFVASMDTATDALKGTAWEGRGRRCRACSCTELRACAPPCFWVSDDLCSACAKPTGKVRTSAVLDGRSALICTTLHDALWTSADVAALPHQVCEDEEPCRCVTLEVYTDEIRET